MHDTEGGTTFCPLLQAALIVRDWYRIDDYRITPDGKCPDCHATIAGRYEVFERAFGPRRVPIAIHRPA